MKKKLLTVALAAVMVVSSAVSAFAATATEFSGAVFAENTGDEELSGDFNVQYSFHTEAKETATDNWDNFLIEFWSDSVTRGTTGKGFLTLRADAFGWWAEGWNTDANIDDTANNTITFTGTDAGWDNWMTDMKSADVVVTAVRTGETIKVDYAITCATGASYNFSMSVENVFGFGDKVKVHLTAEDVTLTNIKFTDNAAAAPAPEGDAPAAGGEDTTTAAGGENTTTAAGSTAGTTTTPNTGDATMVGLLLAVAAVSAVVVLKKRTVAE